MYNNIENNIRIDTTLRCLSKYFTLQIKSKEKNDLSIDSKARSFQLMKGSTNILTYHCFCCFLVFMSWGVSLKIKIFQGRQTSITLPAVSKQQWKTIATIPPRFFELPNFPL